MDAFFDYFAFTLQVSTNDFDRPLSIIQGLISCALEDDGKESSGLYFYSNSVRWDGALVCWGGTYQKETILVSITGVGCRHFSMGDLCHLVTSLQEFGEIRPKRFDLAVDLPSFDHYFDIRSHMEKLFISNRVESVTFYENKNFKNECVNSATIYFGSRTSPRMTRVYTKERKDGAKVTRIEIEAKEGWALRVFELFLSGASVACIMLSLCRDYLAIENFVSIGDTVPVEITYPRRERLQAVASWLLSNVAGCIEDVRQTYGDRFLHDLAIAGWFKRNKGLQIKSKAPFVGTPDSNTGVQISFQDSLNGILESVESEEIE